jgi:hypothetical protein
MLTKQKLFISILLLIINFSCHRNKLKTDQKKLSSEIFIQEKENNATNISNSGSKQSKAGIRFAENRFIEADSPPVVIDIAGSWQNTKNLKLSDIASGIKYIKMEPVPDSTFSNVLKFKYFLMNNYIVAVNFLGINLYSKEGKFIRTIIKNQFTGIEIDKDMIKIPFDHIFIGGGTSVWSSGNNLYYTYSNNITGEQDIIEYDCSQNQIGSGYGLDPENSNKRFGLGEISIELTPSQKIQAPKKHTQGMISMRPENTFSNNVFAFNKTTYVKRLRGNNMLGVYNKNGDTISTFTAFERLKNYTKSLQRGTDFGSAYEYEGKYFFRNAFNDTIFQVIPPNRLLPKYVLKLGKYKVSRQEGVDPGFDLTGKIIPMDWAESKNYVFLTFSKDNYDCPNNRQKKKVKIYYAIYSKINHVLSVVNRDPFDYSSPALENDIDGGPPVWPFLYTIGENGEILISLKGRDLKDHIQSQQFTKSIASANKKDKLKQFTNSISDSDNILMIVE